MRLQHVGAADFNVGDAIVEGWAFVAASRILSYFATSRRAEPFVYLRL
jgi:hypothetical protein